MSWGLLWKKKLWIEVRPGKSAIIIAKIGKHGHSLNIVAHLECAAVVWRRSGLSLLWRSHPFIVSKLFKDQASIVPMPFQTVHLRINGKFVGSFSQQWNNDVYGKSSLWCTCKSMIKVLGGSVNDELIKHVVSPIYSHRATAVAFFCSLAPVTDGFTFEWSLPNVFGRIKSL